MKQIKKLMLLIFILIIASVSLFANEKPYIMVSNSTGNLVDKVSEIKTVLIENGFNVVGEYSPFAGRKVVIFTNNDLLNDAANTEFGAYGAALRIAFTEADSTIQVAYTNPVYWTNAYRMECDTEKLITSLNNAFGEGEPFGSKKGETIKKLRKYHYMMAMPYFDDPHKLAEYESYDEALTTIESGLAANKGGVSKVYRIDIPGKEETVFGVALTQKSGSDEVIMNKIDKAELKHTAYLCYEMVVSGNKAYTLNGKFRIAISFPDLSMGQFTKIISAPGDIKEALKAVAEK